MTCRIARKAKEGLTQRRNVKAQVMGDMAMGRLTVTALTGFFRSPYHSPDLLLGQRAALVIDVVYAST